MRTLVIVPNHSVSRGSRELGVETAEAALIHEVAPSFDRIRLVAFREDGANSSLPGVLAPETATLSELDLVPHGRNALARALNYLSAALRMPAALSGADFVYVFAPGHVPLLACLWCRVLRKPYGLYVRGTWVRAEQGRTSLWWQLGFAGARFLIATGEAFRRTLSRWNPNVVNEVPLTPIRPGSGAFGRPDSRDSFRLLFAGRLIESKGIFAVIEALSHLRAAGKNCELQIAGGGTPEELARVRSAVEEFGVTDAVTLLGHVAPADMELAFRRSHAFVFPTYYPEGFPRVLYESMMLAVPIITTRMPGVEGFLRDGENCLLVSPRSVSEVTEAVLRLMEETSLAERLAHQANEDVSTVFRQFDCASHGQQFLKLFEAASAPRLHGQQVR